MEIENLQSKITDLKSKIFFGAVAVLAGFLWMEHNAHLRSEGALKEIQQKTEAEVSALRDQADSAVRDANQNNARAQSELQASRRLLQQQSEELGQKLAGLAAAEQRKVEQVAALSAAEIGKRLAEQLGPGMIEDGIRDSGFGVRKADGSQASVVRRPLSVVRTQSPVAPHDGQRTTDNGPSSITNHQSPITNYPNPETRTPNPVLLTEEGARKVETALVELDSCREQSSVQTAQLSTCRKEAAADAAMVELQKSSIAKLNLALGDKDQILAKRETEFKAEIKVARGTWLSRLGRVATHVAIGVAIGMVVR